MLGMETSFLENSLFGLIIDEEEEEFNTYDRSLVTSVLETNECGDDNNCDDMIIDPDDDYKEDKWENDEFEDDLLDDIESTPIYDEFDSDYRVYY